MKYYTADPHYGHNNIIRLCDRPFGSGDVMNNEMILRLNKRVTEEDEVFIIGDITLGNYEMAHKYLSRLKGKIFIVPSIGHDKRWVHQFRRREKQGHQKTKFTILENIHRVKDNGYTLVLCHYPLLTWENSFHGSIHLHGHEHGRQGIMGWSSDYAEADQAGFRVDVGVDLWDFRPVTLEEIMQKARRMGFAPKELPIHSKGKA